MARNENAQTARRRRLKWVAILAPIGFLGLLEYARYALRPILGSWQDHLVMASVVLLGAIFFYAAVFTLFEQTQEELESQNRELAALRAATLSISSELSLEVVLQKIVDQATNLISSRYGALSVIDGEGTIRAFLTSGVTERERQKIGDPPIGKGLLGVVLNEGQRLRLESIQRDSRSHGFPANHPAMESLLAVPIICRSPFKGNLYLSTKHDGRHFTSEDEETLTRFAAQAAIAVDNAHLHAKVRGVAATEERLRIARELHDGQAQVLAYVITKAQAVQQYLRAGRGDEAETHLDQLTEAAREVYTDVREGILGLRSVLDLEHGLGAMLKSYLDNWEAQSTVSPEVKIDYVPQLPTDVELQVLRIAQEALTNVRKHSGSDRVTVRLESLAEGIRLTVQDEGAGFVPPAQRRGRLPRFGLATMRERAEAIGASLLVDSRPGEGTLVQLDYQHQS